jgi:hypothetical protein
VGLAESSGAGVSALDVSDDDFGDAALAPDLGEASGDLDRNGGSRGGVSLPRCASENAV